MRLQHPAPPPCGVQFPNRRGPRRVGIPENKGNTLARSLAFFTLPLTATPQWMLSADRVWVGLTPESAFLEWISTASNLVSLAEKQGITQHF